MEFRILKVQVISIKIISINKGHIMKKLLLLSLLGSLLMGQYPAIKPQKLTLFEKQVLQQKYTERPFTGIYNNFDKTGVYYCKQCGQALFTSKNKFKSHCGWPSFDDAIEGAVSQRLDRDGRRVEIVCSKCSGHLGHIFKGEQYTKKNQRFCVNSASLEHRESK